MSSREEKLAAARKKLKEFQGKNKDTGQKNVNSTASKNFKNTSEPSNESSSSCTPVFGEKIVADDSASLKSGNSTLSDSPLHHKDSFTKGIIQLNPFMNSLFNEHSSSDEQFDKLIQEEDSGFANMSRQAPNSNFENDIGFHQNIYDADSNYNQPFQNSLLSDGVRNIYISENEPNIVNAGTLNQQQYQNGHFNVNHLNNYSYLGNPTVNNKNNQPLQISSLPATNDDSSFQKNRFEVDKRLSPTNDTKQFFDNARCTPSSDAVLNDVLQPLQAQLQNHVQTISILVGERNDLQVALNNAQSLLTMKTGELEEMIRKFQQSSNKIYELETKLRDLDNFIQNLLSEKEQLIRKNESDKSDLEKLKVCLESKEEEESELKQKLEAKNKECENFLYNLRETQNQLNMCQIKIQQLNMEDSASLGPEIIELQIENQNMKKKILELEKVVEVTSSEKEQSSQNFHIYAQQCNSQISALNAQLKELTSENLNRLQDNQSLHKNIEDLKIKLKQQEPSTEKFEVEIADLHGQISALTEANNKLVFDIKKKEEEYTLLQNQLEGKIHELNQVEVYLKELKSDNTRLLSEMESSNANERLLAAMESDKVAAARAVSQNQKLKEQILELEGGFVKLSHEKLELTDQLAHERHVNKELQSRLEAIHHYHDDDLCHHDGEKDHPINDSNEIEDLRNIIRQLQDDKTELLSRLNHVSSSKVSFQNEGDIHKHCSHEAESALEDLEKCENSKLLLQQMEEKVKKTMNEIAILDEEKQKLEHLVLQLQGETETIGEYISLYQKQRMLLRQRTKEKDEQLIQLSKDKEELRSKLAALDDLVQVLLADKNKSEASNVRDVESVTQNEAGLHWENEGDTAGKIRALITEIGSTNLVNCQSVAFEHCSCCSGRLINI